MIDVIGNIDKEDKLYYLASPYSAESTLIREDRYQKVDKAAAVLFKAGVNTVNPIGSCHQLSKLYKLPSGYKEWQTRDRMLISRCDGVIVLDIDGWSKSVGVADEIEYAVSLGLEIIHLHPKDVFTDEEMRHYGWNEYRIMR